MSREQECREHESTGDHGHRRNVQQMIKPAAPDGGNSVKDRDASNPADKQRDESTAGFSNLRKYRCDGEDRWQYRQRRYSVDRGENPPCQWQFLAQHEKHDGVGQCHSDRQPAKG